MAGADSASFAHLHLHTEFSMLDGAARVEEVVKRAAADGQPAIAITDHGNMYGVLDFYKAAQAAGVKPIIGIEAYMAGGSRLERPLRRGRLDDTGGEADEGDKLYYHLTLLAENYRGYSNLLKLSSEAYLSGYWYKPRSDWELLERYHEGVIATTGCLGGLVSQALLRGDVEQATAHAARLQDIFGKDSLFVELQDHGIEKQRKTNPQLVEIARHIGAPLLATNDSHYVSREDHLAHDALLCVQTGSTMDDEKRFRFEGSEHYLKTAAEMRALFTELPEACDNTLWVAERANVSIELGRPKLPAFALPPQFANSDDYLRHLTYRGAEARYGSPVPANVVDRLDYELGVIQSMGFSDYFLVVWDLIRHAKDQNIRVGPGRGSTAGCCVAYCLRIVELDPLRYDLIFERFLNPGRKQMPDIDMDFDERYRGEMIRYASERWGWDHVAQIVTFSTIKARAAVRDAARVLGHPYSLGDRIAKAMPPLVMGRDTPLWACFKEDPKYADGYKVASELREMYAAEPEVKRVVDVAKGLEGLRRQDGIHAAAVVISSDPLTEHLPVQRKPEPGGRPEDAPVVTQYEMHGVEELGLLKMDFLGLRNLSVVERTLDLIESGTGSRPDIDHVDLEDAATFDLLKRGDTVGVFQLEGSNMRALARALAPTELGDVAALVALYRPGPMATNMHYDYADRKNGRKPITSIHDDMAEVLSDTYGLMIYQESMLRVAQRFAGYSLEDAETLRRAAAKKVREIMKLEREKFVAGCERTGYGATLGSALFDMIEPFADYAFPKSHAYGYGLVAYWTAWLKANHPVEYMASLLTSIKDDKDKMAVYLAECRAMGIEVLVPDINLSASDFTAVRAGQPSPSDRAETANGPEAGAAATGESRALGGATSGPAAVGGISAPGEPSAADPAPAAPPVGSAAASLAAQADPMASPAGPTGSLAAEAQKPQGPGPGVIPFGLSAIRNVGEGLVERIVSEREAGGPFKDFYDFCNRVDPVVLNKRTVESLIKAGAFDSLGHPRQGLCLVSEQVLDRTLARRREADQGVLSLFGGPGDGDHVFDDTRVPVPEQEFDKHQKLAFEKEMLGLYVSDHPLVGAEAALRRHTDCTILDLREEGPGRDLGDAGGAEGGATAGGPASGYGAGRDGNGNGWYGGRNGGDRWVGGVVTGLTRRYTRRGELMATFVLEDLQSSIEVFVFPRTMTEVGHLLADDVVVCVKGRLDLRDEVPKLVCSELKRPHLTGDGSEPLQVVVPVTALDDNRVNRLREVLREHPGQSPVYLHVGTKVVHLAQEFNVTMSPGLLAELRVLLGPACLWSDGALSR
ncbi:MAG TPA: DNA polymerase III subunit alpha [Acidimicrobiales bacterium]|nr:DNA polymerase III subunit alpha [Acidimicrobiales bacterium]